MESNCGGNEFFNGLIEGVAFWFTHALVLVTHCLRLLVSLEARMRRGRRLVLGPLSPRLSLVAPPFVHRPRTVAWAARARLRKEGEGWKKWKQDMSGRRVERSARRSR